MATANSVIHSLAVLLTFNISLVSVSLGLIWGKCYSMLLKVEVWTTRGLRTRKYRNALFCKGFGAHHRFRETVSPPVFGAPKGIPPKRGSKLTCPFLRQLLLQNWEEYLAKTWITEWAVAIYIYIYMSELGGSLVVERQILGQPSKKWNHENCPDKLSEAPEKINIS